MDEHPGEKLITSWRLPAYLSSGPREYHRSLWQRVVWCGKNELPN